MENNLKLNSHRITGLADATSDSDAVNYKQLKSQTDHSPPNYHLQQSFIFLKDFGDKGQLESSNIEIPNHSHLGLLEVPEKVLLMDTSILGLK